MFPIYAVASEYRVLSLAYRKALSETAPTLERFPRTKNSTGDPALRWEVARVWRLGRQSRYEEDCPGPVKTEARATIRALDN